jgi:hypothetical protein
MRMLSALSSNLQNFRAKIVNLFFKKASYNPKKSANFAD